MIDKQVIDWILDSSYHKKTFFLLTYDYTIPEQVKARAIVNVADANKLIDNWYKVENSFTVYSRTNRARFVEVISQHLDIQE